jgi:hypothetical protein
LGTDSSVVETLAMADTVRQYCLGAYNSNDHCRILAYDFDTHNVWDNMIDQTGYSMRVNLHYLAIGLCWDMMQTVVVVGLQTQYLHNEDQVVDDVAALPPVSTRQGSFAILDFDLGKAEGDRLTVPHAGQLPVVFGD